MKKYYMTIFIMFALITFTSSVCYSADTGTISGKVVDSKSGEGLEKVKISIIGKLRNKNPYKAKTLTNEQGQFILNDIPQGEYSINIGKSGYIRDYGDSANDAFPEVKCDANQITSINFKLLRYDYGLSGIVTDINTKRPIKEARIIIFASSMDVEKGIITDEYGKFTFMGFKSGVYTIKAVADGYMTKYLPEIIYQPEKEKIYSITLEPIPEIATLTFPVKYLPVNEIINRIIVMKSKEGTIIAGSDSLIITDTKENLNKIRNIIAQLDVAPKQIQLEVKLLLASSEKGKKSTMPKELDSIAKQLNTLFRYKNYELLDTARYVALENESVSFIIGKGEYKARTKRIDFIDVNGGLIKLERFELIGRKENEKDYINFFNTTINIPNGDTVILGASNVDASGKALIIAVTAKTMKI